jgi:8-amino-7-oxononanoate synthase
MMLGPRLTFVDPTHVECEGRTFIFFGGIDYHRMSWNPLVIGAMKEAADRYGLSPSGSRTTTGNHPLYSELEEAVAGFFAAESAVVFGSGYLANMILLQAAARDFDIFFVDEQCHASVTDAVGQSGRDTVAFAHTDPDDLERQIRSRLGPGQRPLILTDGVFPARGEIPPLRSYADVAQSFGGMILVDDAHGVGVVGPTGKGSAELAGIPRETYYITGTLSKGFGVFGGIIPGGADLARRIHRESQAFVGSTGLPLPIAAAAIASVTHLTKNPEMITGLQDRSIRLKGELRRLGFDLPESPAPIISITFGDEKKNERLRDLLTRRGIYPPFIRYPGAPEGGHFRFALSSVHTRDQIDLLRDTISSAC